MLNVNLIPDLVAFVLHDVLAVKNLQAQLHGRYDLLVLLHGGLLHQPGSHVK
jgi:hypothetical protein